MKESKSAVRAKSVLRNLIPGEEHIWQRSHLDEATNNDPNRIFVKVVQRERLKLDEDLKFSEKVQNKYTHRMAK